MNVFRRVPHITNPVTGIIFLFDSEDLWQQLLVTHALGRCLAFVERVYDLRAVCARVPSSVNDRLDPELDFMLVDEIDNQLERRSSSTAKKGTAYLGISLARLVFGELGAKALILGFQIY